MSDSRIVLSVQCRELSIKVHCGAGHQSFKWLANVVKSKYVVKHPQFKLEQFTCTNVHTEYSHHPLYPNETISNAIADDSNIIYVELLGPKIGMNDPGFSRQKCMWELLAYTPKHEYVEVVFQLAGHLHPDLEEPPSIIGNFGPHSWTVPEMGTKTTDGNWIYSTMVPATAEILFIWVVDGNLVISDDYETVVDMAEQKMNCLQAGKPSGNYSELYVPVVDPTSYFKNKDDDTTVVRKIQSTQVGNLMGKEMTQEILDKMFETDWRHIKLDDILGSERERQKAKTKLHEYYVDIRGIFNLYARYSSNVAYMNILTFITFCSRCKLPDKNNVTKARLTEIFHYINREFERDDQNKLVYLNDPLNPDSMFTRAEFMEALCRIALIKYDSQPIDFGITSIMENHIHKHVHIPEEHHIRHHMLSEPMQRVFILYDARLWGIFHKYASIVNLNRVLLVKGFQNMLKDHNIVSNTFSLRDVNGCFIQAQQEELNDIAAGDESDLMEMTFAEFLEGVVRVADAIYGKRVAGVDPRSRLHEMLEDLLVSIFPQAANNRSGKKVTYTPGA